MPTPVVIATGNTHKADEIQALLGPDFVCRTLADFPDAPEVEETARTLAGNAALKALSLVNWLKQNEDWHKGWVLADDSGLEVDALDGAPGVRSARYAATDSHVGNTPDQQNNHKLLHELSDHRKHHRSLQHFRHNHIRHQLCHHHYKHRIHHKNLHNHLHHHKCHLGQHLHIQQYQI